MDSRLSPALECCCRIECRRVTVPSSSLIPLAEYAAREHLTHQGALHRIHRRKVRAWKFGGRWFVSP